MGVKEKRHRLPKEFYKGEISAAFTLCLKRDVAAGFSLREPKIVSVFTDILTSVVAKTGCIVPVYCFMPDHQHLIITGIWSDSDAWKIIVSYKQKTGFWMSANKSKHLPAGYLTPQEDYLDHSSPQQSCRVFWKVLDKPEIRWQKDFYDHVIRTNEDVAAQVRYILDNPARKGLVSSWQEYPFKGSIGCKLEDVLNGII